MRKRAGDCVMKYGTSSRRRRNAKKRTPGKMIWCDGRLNDSDKPKSTITKGRIKIRSKPENLMPFVCRAMTRNTINRLLRSLAFKEKCKTSDAATTSTMNSNVALYGNSSKPYLAQNERDIKLLNC